MTCVGVDSCQTRGASEGAVPASCGVGTLINALAPPVIDENSELANHVGIETNIVVDAVVVGGECIGYGEERFTTIKFGTMQAKSVAA